MSDTSTRKHRKFKYVEFYTFCTRSSLARTFLRSLQTSVLRTNTTHIITEQQQQQQLHVQPRQQQQQQQQQLNYKYLIKQNTSHHVTLHEPIQPHEYVS
jgi:hypothetical protein